jgi:uroporphyrinogen decarboxylase
VVAVHERLREEQARALGLVVQELGEEVPVLQTVFSPITVGSYLVGRDKRRVVRELRQHPEVVLPALEKVLDALLDFTRKSVEAGAAGVFYAISGYATRRAVPEAEYRELLLPFDRQVLSALPAAAWFNVLHLCGSNLNFELARKLPAQAISWSVHNQGNPSLSEGRERTGRAVMGGVGQRTPLLGDAARKVEQEVRAAVADTGGRGLLVAPGCSVPPWARDAGLKAVVEAAA